MDKKITLLATALLCAGGCCASVDSLQEAFTNPPTEARPRVWWHWEDGNVTKDGIRKDLEWMHRIGIGGFHHFDAALAGEPVVEKRLVYMDEGWQDAFRYAISLADSLGLEVGVASSPGWSCTGGPWVSEDHAMKKLVWSSKDIRGGQKPGRLSPSAANLGYYRDIAVIAFPVYKTDNAVKAVKVSGRPSRSQWADISAPYNITLEAKTAGGAYRPVANIPGTSAESITVNIPTTFASSFRLRENGGESAYKLQTFCTSRVEHAEEKAGFSTPFDLNLFPTKTLENERFAGPQECVDLTALLKEDGSIDWTAPSYGEWRVMRFGYTLTGKKNYPAPPEATGLEVDKLDPEAWNAYFDNYFRMYEDCLGELFGGKGIRYLLMDSYEAKWPTWTAAIEEEFLKRRGYSLRPWLPVLSGEILCGAAESEKFLFDWRQTIAELYTENYARLEEILQRHGMAGSYIESHENGRQLLADGMDVKRHATVPMSACWVPVDVDTQHSTIQMAMADIRESASVSHLYGKKHTAAESFTADGYEIDAFSFTPAKLKGVADTELSCGVNQFYIHESSHQPLDTLKPGLGLLIYGQWFNRHETWAEQARAWMDYLARSSSLLQQGRNVADVLVYYGEDTNITARYGLEPFQIKSGFNYDFINPSGLFELTVKDGRICAPSGAQYSVLCIDNDGLPQSDRVNVRLLELKRQGAVICLADDLRSVLSTLEEDLIASRDVRFLHRELPGCDIYWVNKPDAEFNTVKLSLRSKFRNAQVWDPVTGEMKAVKCTVKNGRACLSLDMKPEDALFVILSSKKCRVKKDPALTESLDISKDWNVKFSDSCSQQMPELGSFTESEDPQVRYFSGTAEYSRTFNLARCGSKTVLDLGEVRDIARVYVNGQDCGIIWKYPYTVDITNFVKRGENSIRVELTNLWVNRLIGEENLPAEQRSCYVSVKFFDADSPLYESGILGPVRIKMAK